ncbi:MAG: beta-lactamase family protein [Culturomica sp.]|jgi:CubicO group peptidase (beta-lactamase class C family)|nr:beta-lactamase family protein [Culturomica sp.]
MKRRVTMIVVSGVLTVIALLFLLMPTYLSEALVHWYPDISQTYIFYSDTVKASSDCWEWKQSPDYNRYTLSDEDDEYLDKYKTVAFLVIQNDSVIHEEYRDNWEAERLSNLFSASKSIVSILAGIALDEGYIKSLDDKVSVYLPEFVDGDKITVRNLLTMSSGLNWEESYTSPFSTTAQAYYGDNIRELIMGLRVVTPSGEQYSYKSGDTQLLSFVIEAAVGKTLSRYAQEKLTQPMQFCTDALWNLDRKGGDEKTYCCFNTTARDFARFGRLILNHGNWNGTQIVSESYIDEAITPASYLRNEFNDGQLDYYGFQIWIIHYKGMTFPMFKGLDGQYLFILPEQNAIIVRLGHERSNIHERENTIDMLPYLDIALKMLK